MVAIDTGLHEPKHGKEMVADLRGDDGGAIPVGLVIGGLLCRVVGRGEENS